MHPEKWAGKVTTDDSILSARMTYIFCTWTIAAWTRLPENQSVGLRLLSNAGEPGKMPWLASESFLSYHKGN